MGDSSRLVGRGVRGAAMVSNAGNRPDKLGAFAADDSRELNVVIETPKGSRNKFTYDEALGLFKLGGVLPSGAVFPFDFGFVPSGGIAVRSIHTGMSSATTSAA